MKRILFATDFSERSDRALRRATLLARNSSATLLLLHVIDNDRPARIIDSERDAAAEWLREQTRTLQQVDGLSVDSELALAAPAAAIADAANAAACDLLVLGQHRRQVLRDTFLGTTAERTISQVRCPVLVVNGPPVGDYRRVVLATDLSDASRRAAESAAALGIAAGAESFLLHVFEVPGVRLAAGRALTEEVREDTLYSARKTAAQQLQEFARSSGASDAKQLLRHEDTSAGNEILLAADEVSADLIVMGTRGRSGFEKLVMGSVAEEVLRRAARDVLVVPPGTVGQTD